MEKVIINDKIVNRDEANVDLNDRGYHFGDGIYEVIRVINGGLFTAEEHLQRFFNSAKKINLEIPYSNNKIKELVYFLIEANKVKTGIIYLQLTRGIAIRTHEFPNNITKPVLTAFTMNLDIPEKELKTGVEVITADDVRWLRCEIKSLNLLPNVLAKQEAVEKGCYEAIFQRDGIVTEASSANVFIVKEGIVYTHPVTNIILNGITRQVIKDLCKKNGVLMYEKEFTVDELLAADEVFITSTTADVMPVVKIENKNVGQGNPGLVTRKMQNLFREKVRNETELALK